MEAVFVEEPELDHESAVLASPETFDEFYRREYRRFLGLAYSLCGSTGLADDVTQDAFLALFRRWNQIDSPEAWVRRVIANKAVSVFRRMASQAKVLRHLQHSGDIDLTFQLPTDAVDLWAAVRSLPKRQAQVIALRYVDGASIAEIANLLEISDNTVKTHLQRGKHTLNKRLKEHR